MARRKKTNEIAEKDQTLANTQVEVEEEKKFVNLLHVYAIYKQKFRRLTKEEFEELLGSGKTAKTAALKLCKEFMKAKNVADDDVSFEKNIGFLSYARFLPMVALLAERSNYVIKPGLVAKLVFRDVPERFRKKFSQLLVYGFWFLGKVISNSLAAKEQTNRGNIFNFAKGDLGYWWAGVRILDWNFHVHIEKVNHTCAHFITIDPPKYRFYSNRAIHNMGQHPVYFLSDADWVNFNQTIKTIKHKKAGATCCKSIAKYVSVPDRCMRVLRDSPVDSELSTYSFYTYRSRDSVD